MDYQDWDEIAKELAAGRTYAQVAEARNVKTNTFISWCRAMGIKKRALHTQFAECATKQAIAEV